MNFDSNLTAALVSVIGTILGLLLGLVCYFLKRLISDVATIKIDFEVMKVRVVEALNLANDLKETREAVIRLDERQVKMNKDVNELHQAKRDIFERISSNHGRG